MESGALGGDRRGDYPQRCAYVCAHTRSVRRSVPVFMHVFLTPCARVSLGVYVRLRAKALGYICWISVHGAFVVSTF
jgi:hypothetical protein